MRKCIIIGGGPLGLYAATKLKENGISFLLLEGSSTLGGQITNLYPEKLIVDIPDIESIKAQDFIESLKDKIVKDDYVLDAEVTSIDKAGDHIAITSKKGVFECEDVIIAIGLGQSKPRTMGLEGEDGFANILYSLKDFSFLKDKKVVIFGGGDSALDWAKHVSEISDKVSLVHRRTEFRGNPDTIKGCPLSLYLPYVPEKLIVEGGKLVGITIKEVNDGHTVDLDADYILVNYGNVPSLNSFGLPKGEPFGIQVNEDCKAAERIYVIGDCAAYEGKKRRIAPGIAEFEKVIQNLK